VRERVDSGARIGLTAGGFEATRCDMSKVRLRRKLANVIDPD
jgi:hypothetical protein